MLNTQKIYILRLILNSNNTPSKFINQFVTYFSLIKMNYFSPSYFTRRNFRSEKIKSLINNNKISIIIGERDILLYGRSYYYHRSRPPSLSELQVFFPLCLSQFHSPKISLSIECAMKFPILWQL